VSRTAPTHNRFVRQKFHGSAVRRWYGPGMKERAMITLVLAMAENGVIGKYGAIPWRIADDMKRFKALTLGKPVVMGRKTWDSLPRKPLPDRVKIVINATVDWTRAGVGQVRDDVGRGEGGMFVGGRPGDAPVQINRTKVQRTFDGDARFEFD